MTEEELQAVKETGICHEIMLDWTKLDEGIVLEDGTNENKKYLVSKCQACGTEFKKIREEELPETPVIIDLDAV